MNLLTAGIELYIEESEEDYIQIDSFKLLATESVKSYYKKNNYRPLWTTTSDSSHRGSLLLGVLDSSWSYGFDPSWYHIPKVHRLLDSARKGENFIDMRRQLIASELLMSNAYFLYLFNVSEGIVDTSNFTIKFKQDSLIKDPVAYLENSHDSNFVKRIFAFQPQLIEYKQLQSALSKWWRQTDLWEEEFLLPEPKKDSVGWWHIARKSLLKRNYLDSTTVEIDSLVIAALKQLQTDYGLDVDGKPGKQSTWALKLSNYDRFLMAAIALEKWRWKVRGKDMEFRINIPAYELTVHRNDSIIYRARVVTGLPDHETPELTAKVKYFTLQPYWHVPHSISTKEILPYVKRDTSYLNKHSYRIFDLKNNPVNAADVNWKRLSTDYFPYKIRQDGGVKNSLGLIVFFFPNKYDVYLHDTPMKTLFSRNIRAFSHGCMRLQDPFKLAELVMNEQRPKDTITADTLKRWAIEKGENRYYLKKHIPIEVDYITAAGDSLGNIKFHYDVYGRDDKYLKLFRTLK